LFSGQNFRVKNEIQNSISEFARRYGMPVGEIGNGIGNGCWLALPAPAPARRPAGLARPATGHGHRLRPGLPTTDAAARPRVAGCGHGHRTRTDTDGHGHGKPATVKTWQSAGRVAAVCEQKSRQPVKECRQGKGGRFVKLGRRLGWMAYFMRETVARVPIR